MFSTTSTTWDRVTSYQDYPTYSSENVDLTNIDGFGLSFSGSMTQRGDSGTVYVRLEREHDATISGTGAVNASSDIVPWDGGTNYTHVNLRVDSGEAELYGVYLVLWGQIA